jgi:hypothetical protein
MARPNSIRCPAHITGFDPLPSSHYWGLAAVTIALAVSSRQLRSKTFHYSAVLRKKPFTALHKLHSGHIGDYVTFLTFGIAV